MADIKSLNGYMLKDEAARADIALIRNEIANLVVVDATLTNEGEAADAKAAGDAIESVKEQVATLEGKTVETDATLSRSGAAADAAAVGERIGSVEINQNSVTRRVTALELARVDIDTTLTKTGKAAEAAAAGTRIGTLETNQTSLIKRVAAIENGSSAGVTIDTTLTKSGQAADAKSTGTRLSAVETGQTSLASRVKVLESAESATVDTTLTQSGKAADAKTVGTRISAVETAQGTLTNRVSAIENSAVKIDGTLTKANQAADAKAVGDKVSALETAHGNLVEQVGAIQPGLTQAEKSALLTLLGAAAYGSDDMAATYASLKALWEGGDVPVMAVNVTPATLNMTVGGTATLKATVIPGTATDKTVSWSVSPAGIVNINGGSVEAVGVGNCVITATAGGVSGTCSVDVQAAAVPATKVTLNKNTMTLNTGDVETLTATVTPTNSTDAVVWTASPDGIVSVTGGVVEALKAGECVITATAGSASATCSVTVSAATVAVQSVTLNKNALTLTVDKSETLTATVLPANSTDRTVVWSVSPSGFATVTGGVVRATAAGSCTVTAACGGKSASCAVTVEAASSELKVDSIDNDGMSRLWSTNTPLCKSIYVPFMIKKTFTLKRLEFEMRTTAAASVDFNVYCKTDSKDIGTAKVSLGSGDVSVVVDYGSGIKMEAGKEYQIWINTANQVMCYPNFAGYTESNNEYFSTEGSEYRWNNSGIRYIGYVILVP